MFDTPGDRAPRPEQEWEVADLVPLLMQLNTDDLLMVRSVIDDRLPPMALKDMNLEEELVTQYRVAKALQGAALAGDEESNRKAQTVNSTASVLQQLVRMQSEFHTMERFKAIENLMVKYMKRLPKEVADAFVDDYERLA